MRQHAALHGRTPVYAFAFPLAALMLAGAHLLFGLSEQGPIAIVITLVLLGTAYSAVQHAEKISVRIGQPYGTLVLTLAVTIIEVSVLASMMLNETGNPTLAREAVLSTVMFVLTGIVGLCLFLGSLRHHHQDVSQQGLTGYLSVLIAIAVLSLYLPGATYSKRAFHGVNLDVMFIMIGVVALYFSFLYMQTVRHREDFLDGVPEVEAQRPEGREVFLAVVFLLCALVGVVALSDSVASAVEWGVARLNLADPDAVISAVVVSMLLLPETITAVRCARRNQLQRALNTALGSGLATIGLTMPVMVAIGAVIGQPVELSLEPDDRVQLLLALLLSVVSFGTGRTNAMTGLVHLVLFFVYVVTLFLP